MAKQDFAGPVRWLIVDDGPEAQPITFERPGWTLQVLRPEPYWQPGQNTQARNLLAGLAELGADDRVVIIEDDDWYAADWLTTVDRELQHAELVGEHRARYYNVMLKRGRQLQNVHHASLCCTALRDGALDTLRQVCRASPKFIDMQLWKQHRSRRLFGGHRVVGIKGLPGRGGIGMGHQNTFRGEHDPAGALLHAWVGADAELYR